MAAAAPRSREKEGDNPLQPPDPARNPKKPPDPSGVKSFGAPEHPTHSVKADRPDLPPFNASRQQRAGRDPPISTNFLSKAAMNPSLLQVQASSSDRTVAAKSVKKLPPSSAISENRPQASDILENRDPLQSPPIFKNTRSGPEKPRHLSFAAATMMTHQVPHFPGIAVRQPVVVDGEEIIKFTSEEVNQMAAAFTWTLIGKFSTGRPAMMDILTSMKKAMTFCDEIFPVALDQRHVLIRFLNREDFVKAYIKSAWFIKGKCMRIFRWSPNFTPGSESTSTSVWVGLPGLRAHLQDPGAVQSIAGLLGKFLCMHNDVTKFTRPGYTYICVEMDLSKPFKRTISIDNGGEIITQVVDYGDFVPPYCQHCSMIGHLPIDCRRLQLKVQNDNPGDDKHPENQNEKLPKSVMGVSKSARKRAKKKVRLAGLSSFRKGSSRPGIVIREQTQNQMVNESAVPKSLPVTNGKGKNVLVEDQVSNVSNEETGWTLATGKGRGRGESSEKWIAKDSNIMEPVSQQKGSKAKPNKNISDNGMTLSDHPRLSMPPLDKVLP